MTEIKISGKLVRAEQLLEQLFTPECKPSLRWLRTQTKLKTIPHFKIGGLVYFDAELVRVALRNSSMPKRMRLRQEVPT